MTRTVCVPSSLARDADGKRDATRKLGYVARAAAVFRIDRLAIIPDPAGEPDDGPGVDFVETVLAYAATPPYLRQEAWGKRDELAYAGVLPPVRLASQTGSGSNGSGSLRQGIVTEVGSDGRVRVNCGLQHPIALRTPDGMAVAEGERVTVSVSSRRPVRARLVDEPPPGFAVERADLRAILAREDAGFRIATSRYGAPLTAGGIEGLVARTMRDGLTVAFGAPGRGLPAILGADEPPVTTETDGPVDREPLSQSQPLPDGPGPGFDRWLNTVPDQGSETIRTEEAMFASLAPLTLPATE